MSLFKVGRDDEKVSYVADRNVINIMHYCEKEHFALIGPMEHARK